MTSLTTATQRSEVQLLTNVRHPDANARPLDVYAPFLYSLPFFDLYPHEGRVPFPERPFRCTQDACFHDETRVEVANVKKHSSEDGQTSGVRKTWVLRWMRLASRIAKWQCMHGKCKNDPSGVCDRCHIWMCGECKMDWPDTNLFQCSPRTSMMSRGFHAG